MSSTLASLLKSLSLSQTHQEIDLEKHEGLLKACNEALRDNKNSVDAQHVRVVALLSLDRYGDALRQLEDGGATLQSRAQLEYAYALYKEGKLEDALKQAQGVETRAGRHLQAQSSYRLEDFPTAQKLYQDLHTGLKESLDSEVDLRINTGATEAQLEWQRRGELVSKKKASREDLEGFETAFNAASASLARGELPQAELLLNQARNLCIATEEFSDEERKTELLPIAVQQLYVLTLLNKTEQAEKIAEELDTDSAPDSSTSKLAQINRIVGDKSKFNPFMASRILNATPELKKSDQFFEYQNQVSRQNNFALDFLSGKYAGIESSTAKQLRGQKSSTTNPALNAASSANAAAHAQLQLGKAGIRAIAPLLEKRPYDLGLIATMVQLYMSTKNHGAAIKLVEDLCHKLEETSAAENWEVRFSPGLVAIIAALYAVEGRKSGIKLELAKAAAHWRKQSKFQSSLMKAAGHSLIESGTEEDLKEAQAIFSGMKEVSSDRFTTAGYTASYSSDMSKHGEGAASLPSIDKLTAGIDVDALEAAGVPQPSSTAAILSRKRAADAAKPAKKRTRTSRLPKDYDPNKKIDAERWLPIRDRSYYKPKGKKKARNQGAGGAQGAIAADSDAPTPAAAVVQASGGGKSKKKKGKK